MDLDATLQEYQIQLEQTELALRNDAENEELLKLKQDLIEVINLTQELIGETQDQPKEEKEDDGLNKMIICKQIRWKPGDKCMSKWRDEYYPAVIDQILEDGSCTVIFDGYSTSEMTQVSQLMPRNKNANSNTDLLNKSGSNEKKRPLTKRELEQKLREAKKRKREKRAVKLKELEDISEKEKNKWKSFNTKLASKTWKGVVKKNRFELPSHHENKIGVGVNVIAAKQVLLNSSSASASAAAAAAALALSATSSSIASAKAPARYQSESFKQSKY